MKVKCAVIHLASNAGSCQNCRMSVPVSLIIDDGSPVNPMYRHDPLKEHTFIIENEFINAFADICSRYGVRGKFSVMPMPSGLGRIDERLSYVPQKHLADFLKVIRSKITPLFDITPEILTHQEAYDLKSGRLMHINEDEWIERSGVKEMTDYIALAFRILKNVGLPAAGLTSPWATGINNETRYAEAIGRAFYRIHRKKFTWYFLHCLGREKPRNPWITWSDKKSGITVATVPALTHDPFWNTQDAPNKRAADRSAADGVDSLLTRDGRKGRLRELFEEGFPLIILTHWQSLYSEGRRSGLRGLEKLIRRIDSVFGNDVEWTDFSTLARAVIK